MGKDKLPTRRPAGKSSRGEVDAFIAKLAVVPGARRAGRKGRLIFALDATASREPTWDHACHVQAEMFQETAALGGLDIQLAYFRGFGEFSAGPWLGDSDDLVRRMTGVFCLGGHTQIAKLLRHAVTEAGRGRVDALVFVGDSMEEDVDDLCAVAGELGLLGVPVFLFQEGADPVANLAFAQIARLTKGAHCRFDAGSAKQLRDLLSAVAVYAAGGRAALTDFSAKRGGAALRLTRRMKSTG
ncbi:MAG: VWA domain-containing protein [Alphaproteobacteria bacterium]